MKNNNLKYQIVVPFYNDFENFKKFIEIIENINTKEKVFLLVDNGSSSNELVKYSKDNEHQESCWKLIRSEKNLGFGGGVKYGASFVKKDYVAWMPGNLKLNPHDVYIFLEKFQIKEKDFLLKANRVGRPLMDRLKTIIFGLVVSPFMKFNMMDSGGTPNLVNKSFFYRSEIPNDFSFDVFVLFYFKFNKLPIYRPNIIYRKRMYGKSHWQNSFSAEIDLTLSVIKSRNDWIKNSSKS